MRLLLAVVVGIIVGGAREYHAHSAAGMKTHTLVCLGSCVAMLTGEYLGVTYPEMGVDISRIASQVISGIGFLGVGTIMITSTDTGRGKKEVRGLTTAAGLWVCACAGVAAGAGFVEVVLFSLFFIIFTFTILANWDPKIHAFAARRKQINLMKKSERKRRRIDAPPQEGAE